jgi:hypothetical protein
VEAKHRPFRAATHAIGVAVKRSSLPISTLFEADELHNLADI